MEELKNKHIKRQHIISIGILMVGTILSFVLFGPKKDAENEELFNRN